MAGNDLGIRDWLKQLPLIGMSSKPASRRASSSKHSALAARDRMIFMDLARRRAPSSGSRAERRVVVRKGMRH
jgi:hypothetical protein